MAVERPEETRWRRALARPGRRCRRERLARSWLVPVVEGWAIGSTLQPCPRRVPGSKVLAKRAAAAGTPSCLVVAAADGLKARRAHCRSIGPGLALAPRPPPAAAKVARLPPWRARQQERAGDATKAAERGPLSASGGGKARTGYGAGCDGTAPIAAGAQGGRGSAVTRPRFVAQAMCPSPRQWGRCRARWCRLVCCGYAGCRPIAACAPSCRQCPRPWVAEHRGLRPPSNQGHHPR